MIYGTEKVKFPSTSTVKQGKEEFSPKGLSPGSESEYDIKMEMDVEGNFKIHSTTSIKNISTDKLEQLIFYFIPNMFTETNSYLEKPSTVKVESINLDGKTVKFNLEKDTLTVPLNEKLEPNQNVVVDIKYEFTLPEEGYRFTQDENNYFLAQWYPMIATYRNHKWNKEAYRLKGESYHTAFSDFKIQYKLPKDLTLISSDDNDRYPSKRTGVLEGENLKEFYISLLKEPNVIQKKTGDITIRVFGVDERKELHKEISEMASEAMNYFQDTFGPYPHKQLDIILDEKGMEYPGVVTAGSNYNRLESPEHLKRIVVHEIAHQWFYGVISNDPYHDAWLDEGITDLATLLFYANQGNDISFDEELFKEFTLPVNLPLDKYSSNDQSNYIYGKSSIMLWKIFQENGGELKAEDFLENYYDHYQYKEVDTQEFVRFLKYYLNLKDDVYFKDWILLDE
ncbi:M1 family metallopeptidase [Peribacillus frigoritolerans]|uniref:M1 family metallopeptidase n=1 Tax=Peribacillus frigoritolerans TaxID=450367 RepID=UPI00207A887C|nr:M1 family metallopeptidase [Peribacillus frigoritolerans]USK74302.1 M1 family metallopeptidase [Peribacillus frigoritolerans]